MEAHPHLHKSTHMQFSHINTPLCGAGDVVLTKRDCIRNTQHVLMRFTYSYQEPVVLQLLCTDRVLQKVTESEARSR